MDNDSSENEHENTTKNKKPKNNWLIKVFIISFTISIVLALLINKLFSGSNIILPMIFLISFISLGVISDAIATATTCCTPEQFHAMATKKVKGSQETIYLLKNADKVASFCGDVIGDIVGVISGSAGAIIITIIIQTFKVNNDIVSLIIDLVFTALISSSMIAGKAIGKEIALNKSEKVMFAVGKLLYYTKAIFNFNKKSNKK